MLLGIFYLIHTKWDFCIRVVVALCLFTILHQQSISRYTYFMVSYIFNKKHIIFQKQYFIETIKQKQCYIIFSLNYNILWSLIFLTRNILFFRNNILLKQSNKNNVILYSA